MIGSIRMIVDPSRLGFRAVKALYHGDYEAPERLIVERVVKPGDRVIEAGAGMGLISLTIARIVGASNIIAYEPMPIAHSLLADNARLNELLIAHRQKALAPTSGPMIFYADENVVSSSFHSRKDTKIISVDADAISEAVTAEKVNVLVLDVEGAEIDLIKACPLARIDKIVMEVHPQIVGEQSIAEMIKYLTESGLHEDPSFCIGRVRAFLRRPLN